MNTLSSAMMGCDTRSSATRGWICWSRCQMLLRAGAGQAGAGGCEGRCDQSGVRGRASDSAVEPLRRLSARNVGQSDANTPAFEKRQARNATTTHRDGLLATEDG